MAKEKTKTKPTTSEPAVGLQTARAQFERHTAQGAYCCLPAPRLRWSRRWLASPTRSCTEARLSVRTTVCLSGAPPNERSLGARILMLGASPTQNAGLGARMFLCRFAEPAFKPGIMGRFIMSCSIGTGAGVLEYKHRIKPHVRFISGIHRAEIMNPNGWAQELASSISRAVTERPRSGISRHLHAVVVRRGQMSTWTNDEKVYHPDGTVVEVRMPPVAQGYDEFLRLANSAGHDAACAAG